MNQIEDKNCFKINLNKTKLQWNYIRPNAIYRANMSMRKENNNKYVPIVAKKE